MKKELQWCKTAPITNNVRQRRVSRQINESGKPLFIIEKAVTGNNANKYQLFQQTDPLQYIHQRVGIFKRASTAKKVAELIYKDSKYSKK